MCDFVFTCPNFYSTIPYDAQRGVIGAQDPIVLGSYEGLYKLIDITEDVGISVVFLLVRLDT